MPVFDIPAEEQDKYTGLWNGICGATREVQNMLSVRGVIRGNTVLVEDDLKAYEGKAVTVMIHDSKAPLNLSKYRGRGEKMFPDTDPQEYIKGLRSNDRQ